MKINKIINFYIKLLISLIQYLLLASDLKSEKSNQNNYFNISIKRVIPNLNQQKIKIYQQNIQSIKQSGKMNHQYQHKKGPPKMIKDLKCGANAHLRQSLLDISQIQNLNKIFIGRKDHYKIQQKNNDQLNKHKQNIQQDLDHQFLKNQFFLSPQQNLQLIKKQRITNMMKDKMNQMFKQKEIRKFKMRKPVLHKMLEEFKESFRVDQNPKFREALKNSQKNLQHIKINSKKRINTSFSRQDTAKSRSKFVSMSTGKPVHLQKYFPTFRQFVQGKYKVKQQPFVGIDISKIDNYFNTFLTQNSISKSPAVQTQKKNGKQEYLKYINRQTLSKNSMYKCKSRSPSPDVISIDQSTIYQSPQTVASHVSMKNQFKTIFNKNLRSKSAKDPNSNFVKSQQSSKKIINAMQTYYKVKKQKTMQCDTIVQYLKKDRPLTSQIRRKNYTIIGKPIIQDLSKYRQRSQQERIKILQKNYSFYLSLLKIFQHCKEDEIPYTLLILQRIRVFFQSEYILFEREAYNLCKLEEGCKKDFGVNIILQNLIEYAKKEQNVTIQNEEEFQFL